MILKNILKQIPSLKTNKIIITHPFLTNSQFQYFTNKSIRYSIKIDDFNKSQNQISREQLLKNIKELQNRQRERIQSGQGEQVIKEHYQASLQYAKLNQIQTQKLSLLKAYNISIELKKQQSQIFIFILVTLSQIETSQKHYSQASKYLEQAAQICAKINGENNNSTSKVLFYLGISYRNLGNKQKQIQTFKKTLKILETNLPPDSMEIGLVLHNIAQFYQSVQNFEEQKNSLERVYKILKINQGDDNPLTMNVFEDLANNYGILGDYHKQIQMLEKFKSRLSEKFDKSPRMGVLLNSLGNAYAGIGNHQKREQYITQGYQILENHYGKQSAQIFQSLNNLIFIYQIKEQSEKQKQALDRSLRIANKYFGKQSLEVSNSLLLQTFFQMNKKNFNEAYQHVKQSQRIASGYFPPDHYRLKNFKILIEEIQKQLSNSKS